MQRTRQRQARMKFWWAWANRNRLFWANLVILGAVAVVGFLLPIPIIDGRPSDSRLRLVGLFLQWIGCLTVGLDLTGTAGLVGRDGLIRRTADWLRDLFRPRVGTLSGGGSLPEIRLRARGKVRDPLQPGAVLDVRVAAIEKYVAQVDGSLDRAYADIDALAEKIEDGLRVEQAARARAVSQVESRLKDAVAGNYPLLAFGLFWLAVGLAITTLAPEIAECLFGDCKKVWRAL